MRIRVEDPVAQNHHPEAPDELGHELHLVPVVHKVAHVKDRDAIKVLHHLHEPTQSSTVTLSSAPYDYTVVPPVTSASSTLDWNPLGQREAAGVEGHTYENFSCCELRHHPWDYHVTAIPRAEEVLAEETLVAPSGEGGVQQRS